MYCKYCGKELPDGARFCPRCDKSQASQNEENQKNHNKAKEKNRENIHKEEITVIHDKKSYKRPLLIVLILIVAVTAAAVISYQITVKRSSEDWKYEDGAVELNSVTPTPEVIFEDTLTAAESDSVRVYMTAISDADNNYEASYPSAFVIETPDGEDCLFQASASGGVNAHMYISKVSAQNKNAVQLMREYADEISGRVIYSKANNDIFIARIDRGQVSYYKKGIIKDNEMLTFEFVCDVNIQSSYDLYIRYISSSLKFI